MMQKYTIFTKYHSVCITNQSLDNLNIDSKEIIECNKNNLRDLNFSNILHEDKNKSSVIVHVSDIEVSKVFIECIKKYHFVQAAGGIVKNINGDILFIYRNRKWDLPKGHKEIGEEVEQTALREVEEECGLMDLELIKKIGVTYHTYTLNHKQQIKETHWYEMITNTIDVTPQKEEGIEKADWIGRDRMDEVLSDTYLSIRNLFQDIKY